MYFYYIKSLKKNSFVDQISIIKYFIYIFIKKNKNFLVFIKYGLYI